MKNKSLIALVTWFVSANAFALPTGPVFYGGSTEHDACGGSSLVMVSTVLFSQDASGMINFGKVEAGSIVSECDRKIDDDGEFKGVVIHEPGKDCGTGSPVPSRLPYDGPCKSGWVKAAYIMLIAG